MHSLASLSPLDELVVDELFYWDKQKVQLLNPDEQDLLAYKGLKLWAMAHVQLKAQLALGKLIQHAMELKEYQESSISFNAAMQVGLWAGLEVPQCLSQAFQDCHANPDAIIAIAEQMLDPKSKIKPYISSLQQSFQVVLSPEQASKQGLIALAIEHGGFGSGFDKAMMPQLIISLEEQLAIKADNNKIKAKISKAKKILAKGVKEPDYAQYLKDCIEVLESEIIPQVNAKWSGLSPKLEIVKSAALQSIQHGPAAMEALLSIHGMSSSSNSKAQKLVDSFALKMQGVAGEAIAASFSGFPEPQDVVQDAQILLMSSSKVSSQLGSFNRAVSFAWGHLKEDSRASKRDLFAQIRNGAVLESSKCDSEAVARWCPEVQELADKSAGLLSPREAEVFALFFEVGLPQQDVADELGISRPVVAKYLKAIKAKLPRGV